ncbi:aconitase [Dendrothele bispora CBS 962.96]|uniref:Aconitase n=1 Tax=Dendrothele bispora (strain CBS 962.96) TaxID=1314807 RepID=A0A4S8L4J9_DENBC|nr:aconitase [Dendrothele bispora CBS 962.96]
MENVDTDMLVPAPLKGLSKSGFARALFNRFQFKTNSDTNKEEGLDFVSNREQFRSAKIMICDGRNFGCGSSREHAVWALKDSGITCVITPSFGENGGEMEVDRCLGQDKVIPNNRDRLLKGLDDIDLTLSVEEKISEYEARRKEGWRWLELVSRLEGNFKKRVIGGSMEW